MSNENETHADFFLYDLETMSQRTDATILAVAMLCGRWRDYFPFDEGLVDDIALKDIYDKVRNDVKTVRVTTQPQIKKYNRHVSESTKQWWAKNTEALKIVKQIPDKVEPEQLYDVMHSYLADTNYSDKKTRGYIRAPYFDHPILISLFREITGADDDPCPYSVWNVRDTRSIIDTHHETFFGYPREKNEIIELLQVVKHDPKDDVALDLILLYLSGEMSRILDYDFNKKAYL